MTRQEMFNRAYQGVISQGALAKLPLSDACQYRTPEGLRCAASWLLTDDQLEAVIAESLNMASAIHVADRIPGTFGDIGFVHRLQQAHDGADDLGEFERKMQRLAEDVGLQVPS